MSQKAFYSLLFQPVGKSEAYAFYDLSSILHFLQICSTLILLFYLLSLAHYVFHCLVLATFNYLFFTFHMQIFFLHFNKCFLQRDGCDHMLSVKDNDSSIARASC